MGWYNAGIYGGDLPLMWRDKIYEICDSNQYESLSTQVTPIPSDVLSLKIGEIINLIESEEDLNSRNIAFQVLGAVSLHSGFDINSVDNLIEKIDSALEDDEYSKDSLARKNVVENLRNILKEYDPSNPINIEEENLFKEVEIKNDELSKEFDLIYEIIKGRRKKIKSSIEEKSGNKDFDEGYETAADEELDFIDDFVELLKRMKLAGELFQQIEGNISENPISITETTAKNPVKDIADDGGFKEVNKEDIGS